MYDMDSKDKKLLFFIELDLSKSKYIKIKMLTCFLNFKTYIRIFGNVFFCIIYLREVW